MISLNKTTIMVIDDEPEIVKMLSIFLESCNCHVLAYDSPVSAFEFLNQNHSNVDVVITDIRMPEMNGIQLLAGIRHLTTSLPVVLMTGYADFEIAVEGIRNHAFDILLKPVGLHQLEWCITRVMGHLKHAQLEENYQKQLEERVLYLNRLVQEQFEELQQMKSLAHQEHIRKDD